MLVRYVTEDEPVQTDIVAKLLGWQNKRAGCRDTITFDGKLAGKEGFCLLS